MESNAPKVFCDQLPVELVFDILLRLPIQSLLTLMCVSKAWKSLISSPEFIKNYRKTSSNACDTAQRKLIFSISCPPVYDCLTECSLYSVLYSPTAEATNMITDPIFASSVTEATNIQHPAQKSIEIVGSCNGLVCIAIRETRGWTFFNSTDDMCLFLWNPSIRKYRRLPHWGFDFEEYSGVVTYGFGYDGLHDDYKVFTLLSNNLRKNMRRKAVGIYSQRTASWKMDEDFQKHLSLDNWSLQDTRGGHFVNGKLYWAAISNGSGDDRLANKIVSFDLVDETYGDIQLPENHMGKVSFWGWNIGVLREVCLGLLWLHDDLKHLEVDIWILTECGIRQSWTKMFLIRYPEDPGRGFRFDIRFQPVFLLNGSELLLKLGSRLVLYNPEDGSYKDLDINYNLPDAEGDLRVDMYDESLVLLDGHDG
nr:F-box/kelch-repeat protein At3g23880-like [Coffea arabica]